MRHTLRLPIALAYLGCLAGPANAGEAQPLPTGTLVRVTAPRVSKGRIEGTLLSASENQIVIAFPDSEPRTIARRDLTRLEWSRGYHRNALPGAIVGGLVGGVFLGYASLGLCESDSCSVSLPAVGVGVVLGALPGAGIGALIRTRDWHEADPARVQFSIAPVRGKGVQAKLTLRF
jgi:hypothetical protein